MAAFSTLGSSSVLLKGLNRRDFSMMSSCSRSRSRSRSSSLGMKRIEAIATASRESMTSSSVSNLYSLYRNPSAAESAATVFDYKKEAEDEKKDSVTAEKMDRWIKDSIGEIVRNIGEAPFLVQIFSQGPSVLRLEREEALPENWPIVKKRWNQTSCIPDGVILVEQLKDEEEEEATNHNNNEAENQTWGLVVQGRGMECAAPCYILNTCRVMSAGGFCTHFCLARAKCFGESLEKQLSKAWLQGR